METFLDRQKDSNVWKGFFWGKKIHMDENLLGGKHIWYVLDSFTSAKTSLGFVGSGKYRGL